MLSTRSRPLPLNAVSARSLLAADLLTPCSPFTPTSPSTNTSNQDAHRMAANGLMAENTEALATPVADRVGALSGTGVLVRLSDSQLAVRTTRKTLRIESYLTKQSLVGALGGEAQLVEGEEVDFRTDGSKAYDVHRRVV